jgi:hypothetical protein
MTWVMWNLISVCLEIVLLSVLYVPDGTVGHVEFRLSPFGDSVIVGARLVHGLRRT